MDLVVSPQKFDMHDALSLLHRLPCREIQRKHEQNIRNMQTVPLLEFNSTPKANTRNNLTHKPLQGATRKIPVTSRLIK